MKKLVKLIFFLVAATFLLLIEDWYQVRNSPTIHDLSLRIPSSSGPSFSKVRDLSAQGTFHGPETTPVSADLGT